MKITALLFYAPNSVHNVYYNHIVNKTVWRMNEYSGLGDTTVRSFGNRYSGIKETAIPVLETNHIVP